MAGVLHVSLALWMLAIAATTASGWLSQASALEALSPAGASESTVAFDIPSLAIEDALLAFGAASGIEVFVDGSAVVGLRSSPVKGMLTARRALEVLLTGTGLKAHSVGERAISLSVEAKPGRGADFRDYSALLQQTALRRLCVMPELRLGSFRIAMTFRISPSGAVETPTLLSSTGDSARDSRIVKALQAMTVAKPPAALPQPVIMVILPRASSETGDCADGVRIP
ncbi:MAG TPA: hypothetical protein VNK51_22355 [Bradyrhizobium sp.]|nr:hypothetical protein [Bradyrhizobium sp.]